MSEEQKEAATLYLVPTPIGNLQDLSPRALEVLKTVTLIAAEDTRRTLALLSAFGIRNTLISYREQNHQRAAARILDHLRSGASAALVSDAGMPTLSDPGRLLVAEAAAEGLRVISLPGPSAITAALAASGLPCGRFLFLGFPPREEGRLRAWAEELSQETATMVFFESPRRLPVTLSVLAGVWPERRAVIAREISKIYEEYRRGRLAELAEECGQFVGEITVVLEGAPERREPVIDRRWLELGRALMRGEKMSCARVAELLARLGCGERRALYRALSGSDDGNEAD